MRTCFDRMLRILGTCTFVLVCSLPVSATAQSFNPATAVFPGATWETATPAEAGMQAALLEQARDHALTGGGSGYIVRGGKLVFSWGDPDLRYALKSTTKSIGVTALGLALQDGLVGLNDAAQAHLPTVGVPPATNSDTGWLDDITIRQLATHSAGFDKTGGYIDLLFQPGTRWAYSDGGSNWLADLLTVRFGADLHQVMTSRVFATLGITNADLRWRNHSYRDDTINGIKRREFGSGINANVDAMARIGYLYLREGLWAGERILPATFVAAARRPDPGIAGLPIHQPGNYPGASSHYGLLWWNNGDGTLANVPTDAYWSWGLDESFIIVIPSLDIVVARAGTRWRAGWDGDYAVIKPFLEPIAQSVHNDGSTPDPGQEPVVTISSPADGASEPEGSTIHFVGSATDSEDGDLTSSLEWVSNHAGLIGMGGAFSTSTLSLGKHTITASVTDSDGFSGTATIELSVVKSWEDPPVQEDPPVEEDPPVQEDPPVEEDPPVQEDPTPDEGSSPGERPPVDDSGGGGAPSLIWLLILMVFWCRAQAAWYRWPTCFSFSAGDSAESRQPHEPR